MWWRDAVLYQVYLRSYADADGDGVGDLRGVIGKLDHLSWLGVDALWLSPVMPSPNEDWGYDVADYTAIHPAFGSIDDFDELVRRAGDRDIRIVCDLVPNHTSDQHPWFVDARSGRDARHRDFYVWADPGPDGGPPNNWVSNFGGSAWTLDESSGQYYLNGFLPTQPDLNWWNEEVRDAFDDIIGFWFDRGVAGFRIDVCHMIVKDRELRDNPPAPDDAHFEDRVRGQLQVYNANRPEVHDILRRWRRLADARDPQRLLLGETYFFDVDKLAEYYGQDDELNLAFNFPFVFSNFDADELRRVIGETEGALTSPAWPVWTGSNHDAGRFATRWCNGDERKIRCALLMLLTLRGTPVLYYGDEIGMTDTPITEDDLKDPVGKRFWPVYKGRDPGRTPMHWTPDPEAGFTSGEPWLPMGDTRSCNVADQRSDERSVLHLTRDLIALRRTRADLQGGRYEALAAPPGVWTWKRGRDTAVVLNLTDEPREMGLRGKVLISTGRDLDGARASEGLRLDAWSGVVVES